MKDPKPVHLKPPEVIRAHGWQAESRDQDDHLIRKHAPFSSDEDIVWFVRERLEHGETITIWPVKESPDEQR